jgi:protein-glutamine gamma-glutamyltransferase
LRMQVDAIGHYWDNWVVGYNPQTQLAFLSRYLQDVNASRIGMLMLGGFFTMLALVSLMVLRKPNVRVLSGVDRQYLRFCQMLSKQGLARMPGEGPQAYCERLGQARPSLAQAAKRVTELYLQLNYADDTPAKTAALKKAVSAFRFKALTADS